MLFLNTKIKPPLMVLLLSLGLSVLVACSQSPVVLTKQTAGELVMIDRVKVKRQRQFVVPSTSRIGLVVNPIAPTLPAGDKTLHTIMSDEGLYTFNHTFSIVTLLDQSDQKRPQSTLDFIVRASLIDAVTHMSKEKEVETKPASEKKEVDSKKEKKRNIALYSRVRPYHALMKLELIDAQTNQPLDVAIIKSRSGTLGSLKFERLIRQSFSAYSKAITSTYPTIY